MAKGPIILLGAAAVVGVAVLASHKSVTVVAAPKGTSAKDLTLQQKTKLENWAKQKGVPVAQAYSLAKQIFATKF
jgi:hypothetical protein